MFEIKKHSLLGIISLILAIIVIIIITIDFVIVLIWPVISPEDFWYILTVIFDVCTLTFGLLFLTIITTIIGKIAKVVKNDRFGLIAILIGVICFILNWVILLFAHTKLNF